MNKIVYTHKHTIHTYLNIISAQGSELIYPCISTEIWSKENKNLMNLAINCWTLIFILYFQKTNKKIVTV